LLKKVVSIVVDYFFKATHFKHLVLLLHYLLKSVKLGVGTAQEINPLFMKLQFIKNIQFTRLVKADGRLREFNFRKINSGTEGLFTVDVSDDRGNRIIFNMEKNEGHWSIVTQVLLPDWITNNVLKFEELIEEELKNN